MDGAGVALSSGSNLPKDITMRRCRTATCNNQTVGQRKYCSRECRSQYKQSEAYQRATGHKPKDSFYASKEWLQLRYMTLSKYGSICQCCGAVKAQMHVDHIKPRSKFPELALDPNNLQVLCWQCNKGKSNRDSTDWR